MKTAEKRVCRQLWDIPDAGTFVIAGPCSAETESQVVQSAVALSHVRDIHALRAGVWKPRTRPNTFAGIGSVGLEWLNAAKSESGLPVAVEVANAGHVEEALKAGMDILWIGARTATNPFSVQEIADALKGVDVPVLVKNPVCPDVDLWMGALERIHDAGIVRIAAVHRGFSSQDQSGYRNSPMWTLPMELKRQHPGLPMLCDPSHICGRRDLIFEVSRRALDLNFNGLMIESHINPGDAWSDPEQQLTPAETAELLRHLTFHNASLPEADMQTRFEALRQQIDRMDSELIDLLARRMAVSEEIGRRKWEKSIPIFQPDRWDQIVKTRVQAGMEKNLTREFLLNILETVHQESINRQASVMHKGDTR